MKYSNLVPVAFAAVPGSHSLALLINDAAYLFLSLFLTRLPLSFSSNAFLYTVSVLINFLTNLETNSSECYVKS
jgi:hypothetical protein